MARKFPFVAVAALAFGAGCSDDPAANDGAPTASPPRPTSMDRSQKSGEQLYAIHCLACHGETGAGVPNVFPPLLNSARLQVAEHFVHGLIHGYPEPEPNEQNWMGEMPKFGHLSDAQIARIANYSRQKWAGFDAAITPAMVADQRAKRSP